jgi:hypothetical protein
MFANLLVLPALVLTFEKWSGNKKSLEDSTNHILRDKTPDLEN